MNDPASPDDHQTLTTAPSKGRLIAYIVSDVHLNNHPYDQEVEQENPRRRNFREFLTQLNDNLAADEEIQLILNGDILDITGSWYEDTVPWDTDRAEVEALVHKVLKEILQNNGMTVTELKRLIAHPLSRIIYVFGNHDGLLQTFSSTHDLIRQHISETPEEASRIEFTIGFECPDLELYVEHGHLLDPFNRKDNPDEIEQPPLGDVVNILIVNRLVDVVVDKMEALGYSRKLIAKLRSRLHDIEYLRPLALVPVWIESLVRQYKDHSENQGKKETIDVILMDAVQRILVDPMMMGFMTRTLHLPRSVLSGIVKMVLRMPASLPVISFITSKFVRRTHNNQYQYKMAQKLHQAKGYRLVAFGHTHIPGVLPLSKNAYYFNTGSWKPVINLFKYADHDPLEIESLLPDVQFNKIERCGILRIARKDRDIEVAAVAPGAKSPVEFALQTIQSGKG